MSQSKFVAAVQ